MTEVRYLIHNGGQPITHLTDAPLADKERMVELGRELSRKEPDWDVSVVSHTLEPGGMSEFTEEVARFRAGRDVPCEWRVEFEGKVSGTARSNFAHAGITEQERGPAPIPGGIAEDWRHVVIVQANSPEEAEDHVHIMASARMSRVPQACALRSPSQPAAGSGRGSDWLGPSLLLTSDVH